jgi:hypothetical protein
MSLRTGRPASNLLLKVLSGIVAVPILLGIVLFVFCGFAPPLVFLLSIYFFFLWGSRWIFAVWFLGGVILWCGAAHYVVFQMARKKQSRPNAMILPLYGIGWFFSLAGVILFLISWKSGWSIASAMLCEIGAWVCWYLVERSEKKQQARMQFLAVLHRHTQAKLQCVEHLDEYPGLN